MLIGEDGAPFFEPYRDVAFALDEPIWPNNHIHVLRPRPHILPQWLAHALNTTDYSLHISGSTRDKLTKSDLEAIRVPVPPVEEQRRITDYLDTETARIDTLLTKNAEAATLVEERRTSVVAQLLETPGERRPLRHCLDRVIGGVWGSDPGEDDVDVTVYRAADFDRTRHVLTTSGGAPIRSISRSALATRELVDGDLVLEKSGGGDAQPVGMVAVFPGSDELSVPSNFNALLRPRNDVIPAYLNCVLAGAYRARLLMPYVNQTTGIQNIDMHALMSHRLPVPDVSTQRRLATRIQRDWDELDAVVDSLKRQRELLHERRQALITAAATGAIEV